MCNKAGYFKQNFANFLAEYDGESYEAHKDRKEELFTEVQGNVLEIGPGTGVNFPFLKNRNMNWTGLEPNPAMHPFLLKAAEQYAISAKVLADQTESMSVSDESFDYVISSEVLCSVDDLAKSLAEIRRVLRPGGRFLFLEHVVDKQNVFRRIVQKSVPYTPWKFYSDGCRPGRDIGQAIKSAGFSHVHYVDYMQQGSGIILTINRPHIYGWAIK